jgi:hypothetical protein
MDNDVYYGDNNKILQTLVKPRIYEIFTLCAIIWLFYSIVRGCDMSGNVIEFGMSVYQQNPSVYFALISSVIILLFALLMSNSLERSESRVVFIVIPIALATYLLSINLENLEHDFFQNLSTEFIGGLLALILFADWITSNEYTFPIVTIVIFVMAGVFVWQASATTDGFYINLSTEMLGALVTTAVVRRDWLWSGSAKLEETHTEKHTRFQTKRRDLERETAERLCHMFINLKGQTSMEIDKKQRILIESVEIIYEGDYTKRDGGGYQRALYANCRPIETPSVARDHLMVVLDGHEQAVNKATQRFTETFDVQKSDDQLTHLANERTQRRMQVKTPVQSFEQELHEMINMLVTRWQESVQTVDKPSEDFADGYHDAIQYVCDNLMASVETV